MSERSREPRAGAGKRALEPEARAEMEAAFGRDFSDVRVQEVPVPGASALAVGNDLFFGPGQYAPGTPRGRRTLAHELAHVAQHQRAPGATPERSVARSTDESEREAERAADAVTARRPVRIAAAPRARIHALTPENITDLRLASALALQYWLSNHAFFTRAEMFADPAALAVIRPKPAKEDELDPLLKILVDLRLVKPADASGKYEVIFDRWGILPEGAKYGTQQSTAPIAESFTFHPQRDFAWHYIGLAGKLVPWIDARTSPFTRAELFADKAAMKLVGDPKTEAELAPLLDLLVKYGVLTVQSGSYTPVRAGKALSTGRFDKATAGISDPKNTIDATHYQFPKAIHDLETSPRSTWATSGFDEIEKPGGGKDKIFFKDRAAAADKAKQEIAALEQQIAAAPDGPGKDALQKKLAQQKKIFDDNTRHWQFAPAVSKFFERLRGLTSGSSDPDVQKWTAATYAGHQWEEYSADIYLGARSGPWPEAAVIEFFTKLDQAAVAEGMAWRAIYDPDPVRAKLNAMFGERRVLEKKPDHSNHIHLNVRPTKLEMSEVKGFK